jgi:hypothetical protein
MKDCVDKKKAEAKKAEKKSEGKKAEAKKAEGKKAEGKKKVVKKKMIEKNVVEKERVETKMIENKDNNETMTGMTGIMEIMGVIRDMGDEGGRDEGGRHEEFRVDRDKVDTNVLRIIDDYKPFLDPQYHFVFDLFPSNHIPFVHFLIFLIWFLSPFHFTFHNLDLFRIFAHFHSFPFHTSLFFIQRGVR